MNHDPFDVTTEGMTLAQRAWRVAFLLTLVAVAALDLFVWRAV